jgi:NADPH2 dehydrogenase
MIQLSCGNVDINRLTVEQIRRMQADCVSVAEAARQAGFDGVEYHFAHGFTLCKFFDPSFNKRTDDYGGSLENRTHIITEMLHRIRDLAGQDFIAGVRMGGNIPDIAGAVEVARVLEKAGVDLLHISFGMTMPINAVPTGFNGSTITYNGSQIKKQIHMPVIGVYEIDPGRAKFLIENDYLDLVSVGRGMLADENWANKVLAGEDVNECRRCGDNTRGCRWFDDHTLCPARE